MEQPFEVGVAEVGHRISDPKKMRWIDSVERLLPERGELDERHATIFRIANASHVPLLFEVVDDNGDVAPGFQKVLGNVSLSLRTAKSKDLERAELARGEPLGRKSLTDGSVEGVGGPNETHIGGYRQVL